MCSACSYPPKLPRRRKNFSRGLGAGISPRRLGAFTLALGFAIGCIPLFGVTTALCALLAMALGLNMPAIQAANWLAMPLPQLVLLIPFLKLGQWLFPAEFQLRSTRDEILTRFRRSPGRQRHRWAACSVTRCWGG